MAVAQLVDRRVSDQKVSDSEFDSRNEPLYLSKLCPTNAKMFNPNEDGNQGK